MGCFPVDNIVYISESDVVAKNLKITPDAVRKSIQRITSLIEKLFDKEHLGR